MSAGAQSVTSEFICLLEVLGTELDSHMLSTQVTTLACCRWASKSILAAAGESRDGAGDEAEGVSSPQRHR